MRLRKRWNRAGAIPPGRWRCCHISERPRNRRRSAGRAHVRKDSGACVVCHLPAPVEAGGNARGDQDGRDIVALCSPATRDTGTCIP